MIEEFKRGRIYGFLCEDTLYLASYTSTSACRLEIRVAGSETRHIPFYCTCCGEYGDCEDAEALVREVMETKRMKKLVARKPRPLASRLGYQVANFDPREGLTVLQG